MNIDRRTFIKRISWALAGVITTLGFSGCRKELDSDTVYTVKGAVTNKATGKPIEGIRVSYNSGFSFMYGPPPTPYTPKAHVLTDSKGEFKLSDRFSEGLNFIDEGPILPVFVSDVDGEENGLFQSEFLQVDFSNAVRSINSKGSDEYTVNKDIELTEI
ncbi:MAG: radical SAM-associated putative lipoprotein [Bacteroidales bacterium]|nr:radical SAM-associated putative lipoprotein [Bacteroidales bacterium]MCL2133107.1 radical SAM-associated putative lipoprotein [Bacteroidales bacterium]